MLLWLLDTEEREEQSSSDYCQKITQVGGKLLVFLRTTLTDYACSEAVIGFAFVVLADTEA